ncbi:MAG TPA: OmpA family protein [Polyangium sp.]|nr:OmpA family protein [Polyangium sp.]
MSRTMTSAMVASFLFLVGCGGGGSAQVELKTGGDATPPSDTPTAAAANDVGEAHFKGDHLEIDHQILFDTDSDHINEAQSQKVLGDLVTLLKAHPELVHLRIEGHTDVRGSAEHNQDLSERRAKAVAQYLNSHGLPNVKIDAKGYGVTKPLCSEDNDACHDKNRRVEFLIVKD